MNIEFYENDMYKKIELSKTTLYYCSVGQGKTKFCNFIVNGLTAKGDNQFIVNGVIVDKSMFETVYIDQSFDFDDYLKFKVKGSMFKNFKKEVLDDYEDSLNTNLMNINSMFKEFNLSAYFDELNKYLLNGKVDLNTGISSIVDLYNEMFSLVFNEELLPLSTKIEIVLKHNILYRDKNRTCVFVIDDVLVRLKSDVIKSILELIHDQENIYVVFTSSVLKSSKNFEFILFKDYTRLNKEMLFKYLFVYENWNNKGDFNSFYDMHHHLVEGSDLCKYEKYLSKIESHITDCESIEDLIEVCKSYLTLIDNK